MARRWMAGLWLGGALTMAAQSDPELRRMHALADAGQAAQAEAETRAYLKQHGDSAEGHFVLGYTLFRQRKATESLAEYTEGAKYQKPSASDLIVVGNDYVLLADYLDADKWYTKALEWDPKNFQILYYLGRTKYNENRFDEAVSIFQQCLAADERNVKAEDNLGLAYQGLGKMEEAEAAFRQAIAWQQGVKQRDAGPYLNLGSMLVDTDRPEAGIEYLQAAIAVDPEEVKAHRALGKAFLHLGRLAEAQAELELSVRMQPNQAATHFVLAQVYRRRGLLEKAKDETGMYTKLSGKQGVGEGR